MLATVLGLLVLLVVLGGFMAIGMRTAVRGGDLEDYVVARDSQATPALALSFLASGMGAWILFAPPEVGTTVGLVGVVGYALGAGAPLAVFALVGPRLRAVLPRGHGLTEFVRLRFGRGVHAYVVAISLLYMLVFVTAELTAVGGLAQLLAGIDPTVTILAVAAATLAYTAVGGLPASLRTDRWQAWLLAGLLAIGVVAVVAGLEAPGRAWTGSGRLAVGRAGIESAVTLVLAITAANLFHQGYWQRVFAARDRSSLAAGAGIGGVASVLAVVAIGATGVLAAGAPVEVDAPSLAFFALLEGLPDALLAVVLVLGLALVASSVDTLENGLASLVVAERPSLSLPGARWVTVGLLVPVVVVAVQGYSVLRLLLIADLLCATAVVPVMLGLWRQMTPRGALVGAAAGVVGAVAPGWVGSGSLLAGLRLASFPTAVPTLAPFVGAIVASTVVAVAVSLARPRPADLDSLDEQVPELTGSTP